MQKEIRNFILHWSKMLPLSLRTFLMRKTLWAKRRSISQSLLLLQNLSNQKQFTVLGVLPVFTIWKRVCRLHGNTVTLRREKVKFCRRPRLQYPWVPEKGWDWPPASGPLSPKAAIFESCSWCRQMYQRSSITSITQKQFFFFFNVEILV